MGGIRSDRGCKLNATADSARATRLCRRRRNEATYPGTSPTGLDAWSTPRPTGSAIRRASAALDSGKCTPAESAADPAATVHHADLCTWQAPRTCRFVSTWDSIWHVCLEQQHDLLLKPLGLLEPGVVPIVTADGRHGPFDHADAIMGRPTTAPRSAYPGCFGSSMKAVRAAASGIRPTAAVSRGRGGPACGLKRRSFPRHPSESRR